jgi:polysaccharide biosynthesis/export protein
MTRSTIVVVLAACLLSSPAGAQEVPAGPETIVLRPGDVVRIAVWRQPPEWSGEFVISPEGYITHPLYRAVRVTGVPMREVEAQLRTLLSRYDESPNFVVEPLVRVAITGEVRQPSLYRLSPGTTLAEAVALAGGPTERAGVNGVRLLRDGQERTFDLRVASAEVAQVHLRSGDQVVVPRRASAFRDVVVPAATLLAAVGWLVNLVVQ